MYNVTIYFLTSILTIPANTRHDAECILGEWQRLGLDGEVRLELAD